MSAPSWKLPGYLIERLLGAGASGEVWQARVKSSGDPVALKRIRLDGPDQLRAARSEAAVLAGLDHPNLVRVHQFTSADGAAVLVLDLASGGSLAQLLQARGRLTPGEVITALAPVGAALAHAHNAGVTHGDVTPGNVLFTDAGLPLLADLGVARLLGSTAPVHSTPAYIDPAVAAGRAPGPASDVFMLAATAVHALTGATVWPGDAQAALAAAATGEPGDIASRLDAAGVPAAMSAVVCRALAVDPQLRGTAADFALDLRHSAEPIAVELSAGRARPVPTSDRFERPRRTGGRHAMAPAGDGRSARGIRSGPMPPRHGAAPERDTLPECDTVRQSGRPAFAPPRVADGDTLGAGAPPITHGVRVPAPLLPARSPSWRSRRTYLLIAGCVALVLIAGVLLWWPGDRGAAQPRALPARASQPASAALPGSSSSSARPSSAPQPRAHTSHASSVPGPSRLDARAAAGVLARLDARRVRAFATRNPTLLSRVYVTGPLLTQDSALLASIVPSGCGLVGAHTTYRNVSVQARSVTRVVIIAHATLAGSSLRCHGHTRGRAPGAGPVTMRIVLVHQGSEYRIRAQRRR